VTVVLTACIAVTCATASTAAATGAAGRSRPEALALGAASIAAAGPARTVAARSTPVVAAGSAPAVAAGSVPVVAAGAMAVAPSPTSSASCSAARGPLFGVVRTHPGRALARIARRTLRPRPPRRVPLPDGVYGSSWDYSPGCEAVALGGHRGRVLLVDLERGRRVGALSLGSRSPVGHVAWPRPDRLTGLTGPFRAPRLVTVSVPEGRVISSRRIGGRPWAVEVTDLGIAVVAGPGDRIGSATLVFATPDGGFRRLPLPRIRAGFHEVDPLRVLARQIIPGLTVDPEAGRAYVVAASEPLVSEVDLSGGTVAYHKLRSRGSAAGSMPVAAKGLSYGAHRTARLVAPGTIAVAGEVIRTRPDSRRAARRGLTATRTHPYGLRLIRTADWTTTTLNPLLQSFTVAGGLLLGMNSDPTALGAARPTALVAYGPEGKRRFTRFRGDRRAWLRAVAWPYAYVRGLSPRRTYVVDLRTGRTVHETGSNRPPVLLVR
jgi:hypothetical protein